MFPIFTSFKKKQLWGPRCEMNVDSRSISWQNKAASGSKSVKEETGWTGFHTKLSDFNHNQVKL